jgi:hypothetical protein
MHDRTGIYSGVIMLASIMVLTKVRNAIIILLGAGVFCLFSYTVNAAGKYDGSIVCVPTAVTECVSEGECRAGTAESENLPDFFIVNMKQKMIVSKDKTRLSVIKLIDKSADEVTLYGTDSRRSWILMIQDKTGRMSASVLGAGESFVLFGVCPLP